MLPYYEASQRKDIQQVVTQDAILFTPLLGSKEVQVEHLARASSFVRKRITWRGALLINMSSRRGHDLQLQPQVQSSWHACKTRHKPSLQLKLCAFDTWMAR